MRTVRAGFLGAVFVIAAAGLGRADVCVETPVHVTRIAGVVSDPDGATMPGIEVRLESEEGREIAATTTDEQGWFKFDVAKGEYVLRVAPPNFSAARAPVRVSGYGSRKRLRVRIELPSNCSGVVLEKAKQ